MKHINLMKYINIMQHIIIALYRKSLICALTVLLVLLGTTASFARAFEKGEKIYVNGTPSSLDSWSTKWKDGCELWCKLIDGGTTYWIKASGWYTNTVYYFEIPEDAARNWNYIKLGRYQGGATPAWSGEDAKKYNITGEILINGEKNYIENFAYGDGWKDAFWSIIAPSPIGKPTGMAGSTWNVPYDNEEICTSAKGTAYILAPKNYDYNNSKCHAWFKYNNSTGIWDRFSGDDNKEFRVSEGYQDEITTLGAAYSDTYYFYQSNKPSACRLLRVRLNLDCEPGAEGACAITSFAAVASDANVTDKTCAIDGEVAFEDTTGVGDLMIWSVGVDTVIIAHDAIKIPQTFKLTGFDASTEKSYTLQAKFTKKGMCYKSVDVTVKPPSATIITHTTTNSSGSDISLTRFTDQSITLYPNNTSSTGFMWINSKNDDRITSEETTKRIQTFSSSTEADITYTFIATNDPVIEEPNLISVGGSFEKYTESSGEFTSAYEYWGKGTDWEKKNPNFYDKYAEDNPGQYASGGFYLCTNSYDFANSYNKVTPHEGDYFGLFDSKIYDGKDQDAWRVEGLSVQKGISYLFSFWVANINNWGEMDNGARLQFQISYNNGSTFTDLGGEINLSNYRDNRWHGISSIVTPPDSYNEVVIRVINKNRSSTNRGNDFGLDDIRFEAITSRSSNVAAYEVFPVKFVECKITGATFSQRQPTACGADKAVVDYTINFENPRGTLYIYEGTTKVVEIPFSATEGKTSYTGTFDGDLGKAEHELTVYFNDGVVKTDAPETYSYTAHAKPAISVTSMSWSTPACDETTCTLTAVLSYTNQNGTLSANVDGKWNVDPVPTYTSEDDDPKTVTLTIPGITADGNNHKLNVLFSGSHGCPRSVDPISPVAPKGNVLHSFSVKPEEVACDAERYQLRAGWRVSKATGGVYDKLIIKNKAGVVLATIDTITCDTATAILPQTYKIDSAHVEVSAYLEQRTDACAKEAKDYKTVVVPNIVIPTAPTITDTACNVGTYTANWDVSYINQRGTMKAWLDSKTGTPKTYTITENTTTATTPITISFSDLVADGSKHKLIVLCDGARSCERTSNEYTAPIRPVFKNAERTYTTPSYGELEYDVTVSADLSNALGRKLCVKSLDLSPELSWDTTLTVDASGSVSHTFKNITTDHGVSHSFRIYFDDLKHCGDKLSYTSPDQREFKTFEVIRTTEVDCDGYYYAVFHIEAAELGGNLVIREGAATPYMDKLAPSERDYLDSVKLVADGLLHTLTATYTSPEKTKSATFTAPAKPTISMHDDGANEPDCKGIVDKQLHVTITNQNPDAYLIVKEKGTPDKEIASVKVEDISTTPYKVTWNYPADGTERQAYAYVSDRPECQTPVVTGEPKFAQKWEYTRYPSVVACDGSYTDTLKFTWSDAIYDLFIDSVDDASNRYICTKPVGTNTIILHGNVAITEHNKDVYRVYFSNYDPEDEDCDSIIRTVVPSASLVPYMDVPLEDVHYSTPECNDTKTDLIFKLKYARQSDNLKLYLNTIEQEYTIVTGSPISASASEQEVTIKIADLTADGKSRSLRVQFIGDNCCDDTYSLPATPFSPHISDTIATVSGVSCDKDTYTLTVTFKADNHQAKAATVKFRGETKTQTSSVGEYSVPFENVTRTYSDKNDDFVEIYFEDAIDDCARHATAHYTEHPKPAIVEIIIDGNQGEIDCEATSYTLKGSIRYVNLNEKPKVWLNNGEAVTLDEVTLQSDDTLSVAITGISVPATGTKDTIHVSEGGCSIEQEFVSIWRPQISEVTAAPSVTYTHCDGTYDVSGIVTYTHGNLQDLVVECYGASGLLKSETCHTNTIGESGEVTYTLVGLLDIGEKVDTVKAYFVGTGICDASKQTTTYTTPIEIIISSFSAYAQPKNCNDDSYTVKGELTTRTAQSLDIYVKDASGNSVKATHKSGNTYEYTLKGVTVPGANNSLTAYFDGKDACYTKNSDNTFNEPTKPEASVLSVKPQQPDCDVTTCEVEFAISFTYQNGNQVTVWVDDDHKAEQSFTIPADSIGQSTAKTITGTLNGADLLADGTTGHVLHYQFAGDHACGGESTTFDFPNINPTPVFSLDPIGRLCNSDTELLLSFTINPGEVAEATLTLKNSNEEFVIDADNVTSGILSFGLPAQLAAGKYTATVEVLGTLGCKTSDTLPVEFALDSVVFSKWTDVLLVDNIDGSFKSYQWYENNSPIDTGQVLYYEAMNKDSLYYCRIVTTAGDTIYTCDFVFDSIPRSADHPKQPKTNQISVLPNRVVANGAVTVRQSANENLRLILISTTGKRVAQYTQTESTQLINMPSVEGIYLLRIETDSDVQTVKIVVY